MLPAQRARATMLQQNVNASAQRYLSHQLRDSGLYITTTQGTLRLAFITDACIEVLYQAEDEQLPAFALQHPAQRYAAELSENSTQLVYHSPALSAYVTKSPFTISYYRNQNELLSEDYGFISDAQGIKLRFSLAPEEKLFGGGQRVLGMDRRGHRLNLYNKTQYGYSNHSEQMYYSLPAVMSDKKYLIVFDNSARGVLDIGSSDKDILQFEAIGGRSAYFIVSGDDYPELIRNYTEVSGRQPLPPRWALGSFASRFGYRSEAEVRDTVARYQAEDFPLDAVVIDLYWFGKDIQGHVGNLDWERENFPTGEAMLADFQAQGVNTILISEPYVLTSSQRWDEAKAAGALALAEDGTVKTFDFYFGTGAIIDVFSDQGSNWFNGIYHHFSAQGVAGWWGDLGEPEMHPADTQHAIGSADLIHNVYGHRWAEMLYQQQREQFPERRPFIMMRSGFAGSQRYGMIPWTGDVSRSWEGLSSQVELALQMSLFGVAYMHSDLGGFAGGEEFDREMYIRWLQYGVFQPVFRPHAQDHIPSEPVFHDSLTKDVLRPFLKLRYRLLPYIYSLAYQNSSSGMPMMRPVFFSLDGEREVLDHTNSYLWGDAFLVTPVIQAGVESVTATLPQGVWFDYWNDTRHTVNDKYQAQSLSTELETLPVLVKAGAFIPYAPYQSCTRAMNGEQLEIHYYHDASVHSASGLVYDDDGTSPDSLKDEAYHLLHLHVSEVNGRLRFQFHRSGKGYSNAPESRQISLVIHNYQAQSAQAQVNGVATALEHVCFDPLHRAAGEGIAELVKLSFEWADEALEVLV